MAERKAMLGGKPSHPELERLLAECAGKVLTERELQEQRVSFAYGNAPASSNITKESVRNSSKTMRIAHA